MVARNLRTYRFRSCEVSENQVISPVAGSFRSMSPACEGRHMTLKIVKPVSISTGHRVELPNVNGGVILQGSPR